jgi:hypothetical protein
VTGHAARYAQLLVDFGHIEEEDVNRLLLAVGEVADEGADVIDLAVLRRASAMWLYPQGNAPEELPALLFEDWPLLFS